MGATIDIERNAGWACGEGMSKGLITVGGYCGMSCGAAMIGGTIHVKGDAGLVAVLHERRKYCCGR